MTLKTLVSLILVFSFSSFAFAEEDLKDKAIELKDKAAEVMKETVQDAQKALSHSRKMRQDYKHFGLVNWSPIDFILPSKLGLTYGRVDNPDNTWEVEYLKSSVSIPFIVKEIGEMSDERLSFIKRNYFGTETFNFNWGASYYRFKIHLGNEYLSSVSPNAPNFDAMDVQSVGFNLGIGNRWVLSNRWIVGMDWISWSQPVFTTRYKDDIVQYINNESDREDARKVLKTIKWIPRITLLKLQVGYSF